MQQLSLIQLKEITCTKVISLDSHINAAFTDMWDDMYEVVLEVNSNKFLIMMKDGLSKIDEFEVVASKWYMDITKRSLKTLKKLVRHMFFMSM